MKPRVAFLFLLCICLAGCAAPASATPAELTVVIATADASDPKYGRILADDGALSLTAVLMYADGTLVSHSAYYEFASAEAAGTALAYVQKDGSVNEAVLDGVQLTVGYAESPYGMLTPEQAVAVLEAFGFRVEVAR